MRALRTSAQLLASAATIGALYLGGPSLSLLSLGGGAPRFELVEVEPARAPVWLPAPLQAEAAPEAADAPALPEPAPAPAAVAPPPTPALAVVAPEAPAPPVLPVQRAKFVGLKVRRGLSAADLQPTRATPKPRAPKCAEPPAQIRALGPELWEVERAFVESYAHDWDALQKLAAVYRHDGPDGKPDGFRVRGVRCGTPLHAGGLRSGDVVHSVNDRQVTNVLEGLMAWRKLRKKDVIRVELTRAGERIALTYRMID